MDKLLEYTLNSVKNYTKSLKKKGILVEKPWALLDDDGEIQKLIFKKDKGLILSKNGKVTEGTWDYFPEAKSLLIDRGTDKLLLKEQFIDDNVLILKKDGTDLDYFTLANENTVPDYNVSRYLNSLKCEELGISEQKLLDGNVLQIHSTNYIYEGLVGNGVELIDANYNSLDLKDGSYMTASKEFRFYVKNGKISSTKSILAIKSSDSHTYELENGSMQKENNTSKRITINGRPLEKERIVDLENIVYFVNNSIITEIKYLKSYQLSNGFNIKIEQRNKSSITKGDKIVSSKPVTNLPDGKYQIKGTLWRRIKIKDSIIQQSRLFWIN